jgi:O-antigen ligase
VRRVELGLLVALCLVLPLYEAPKNIFCLLYLLTWIFNRLRARDAGGPWDSWDTLIAAWIASGFAVAPFAALHGNEWHGATDLLRYGSVLWLAKRTRFTEREATAVLGALVASALIGVAQAFARLQAGSAATLQLNSVGHVNHTAIYLAIVLGLCASWLFTGKSRAIAGIASAVVLYALFVTASRGAIAAGLVMLLVLGAACWRRERWPLALAAAAVVVSLLAGILGGAEVVKKQQANMEAGVVLSYRDKVWALALETWRAHPWFGVGPDNFEQVARAQEDDPNRSLYPHPHNLYIGALVERGIVGAAPLAAVLIAWPLWLVRRRPGRDAPEQEWLLWSAAGGAWMVSALVGVVNTTLNQEHGLLAALLLGLWLSRERRR